MINLNSGYNIQTGVPVDSRMILSKAEMKAVSDGIMDGTIKNYPDNFFCICKDDATTYAFSKTYEETDIGRFLITPKKPPAVAAKYGMRIDASNGTVTYLNDCADFTPLSYDTSSKSFSLGSWKEDEFFMPRPCLLNFDGTVKYYIDPNDYTKNTAGERIVNIKNAPSDGNFMVEWGRDGNQIWYKVEPDEDNPSNCNVYFNPTKIDDTYHAWSFLDHNGNLKSHFYTGMFVGVSNPSSKLRSYYATCNTNKSYLDSRTMAAANNVNGDTGWNIEAFCDRMLINYLLILITKHIDPVKVIGLPSSSGNKPGRSVIKGGLFARVPQTTTGTSTDFIRVFGIDDYYASFEQYVNGLFSISGYYYYKMCEGRSDGTTTDYYNTTGDGYKKIDILLPSTKPSGGGHIKTMTNFSDGILLPTESGSNSFYSENMYTDSRYTPNIAEFGGYLFDSSSRSTSGPFCVAVHDDPAGAWNSWMQGRLTYR